MEIVRKLHEAFNARDRDALLALLAEDVRWHLPGPHSPAGGFAGRQAVWDGVFAPLWASPARLEDRQIVEHGEHVVAFVEWFHNFGEGERGWKAVEVLRLAGGLVVERHEHMSHQEELARLFERGCVADSGVMS